MTANEPRQIAFEDIRKGDDIEARWTLDGLRLTRRGIAHHRNPKYWYTEEGSALAKNHDGGWTHYLHHRPTPTEPEGLGAIVRTDGGVEYVSVNRKPGTRRWVDAGLHEGGSRWALKWADLNPDSIEVLTGGSAEVAKQARAEAERRFQDRDAGAERSLHHWFIEGALWASAARIVRGEGS